MLFHLILSILLLSEGVLSTKPCHGHECDAEIDTAIENVDLLFTVHLCNTILSFNCDDHLLTHDEQICGSNGVTYDNHCLFTQARCRDASHIHGNHYVKLGVRNHGPCVTPSPTLTTNMGTESTLINLLTDSTLGVTVTASTSGGHTESTYGGHHAESTYGGHLTESTYGGHHTESTYGGHHTESTYGGQRTESTHGAGASTSPLMTLLTTNQHTGTTIDPGNGIAVNVFCKNAEMMVCQGLTIICGSDGSFYPNECDFLKGQCKDPTLTRITDMSSCT